MVKYIGVQPTTKISVIDETSSTTQYLVFVADEGFNQETKVKKSQTALSYVPSTGTLASSVFSGSLAGNSSTATALADIRTIWGQNFDGTANVTGNLTGVGNITGTGAIAVSATNGTLGLAATGANIITASTNAVERIRITGTGNVGIGEADPTEKLHVNGNVLSTGDFNSTSDIRLKTNWNQLSEDFLYNLTQVQYGTYDRIDTQKRQAGVSAQDIQKILPETVSEDANGYLSVDYGKSALVAVIQLAKEFQKLKHCVLNGQR